MKNKISLIVAVLLVLPSLAHAKKCAYVNQYALDKALFLVDQSRDVNVNATIKAGKFVQNVSVNGKKVKLGKGGALKTNASYKKSLVLIDMNPNGLSGLSDLYIKWFRPGRDYKKLSFDLDVTKFRIENSQPNTSGKATLDIYFDPNLTPSHIFVDLSDTFRILVDRNMETLYDEVKAAKLSTGHIQVTLDLKKFLTFYNESTKTPIKEGDHYQMELEVVFDADKDFFNEESKVVKEHIFEPKVYKCFKKPTVRDANAEIPMSTPESKIGIKAAVNFPVLSWMVK